MQSLKLFTILAAIVALAHAPLSGQTAADSAHAIAQRVNIDTVKALLPSVTNFCATKTAKSYPTMCRALAAANRRASYLTLAESTLVATVASAAPPAPVPTPTPAPIDTSKRTTLCANDFEGGTFGCLTNPWDADIDVIADPTNSGHGKVARMHYAGTAQDKNRALQFEYGPGIPLGQSIQFDGDVYLPASLDSATSCCGRKLLYWQRDPAAPDFAMVLTMYGTGLSTSADYVNTAGAAQFITGPDGGAHYLSRGVWHHLTLLVRLNSSFTAKDGVIRFTVDGVVLQNTTTATWSDPFWTSDPTKQRLRYFLVGEQVNSSGTFDEVRYWDNLRFSIPLP